MWMRVRLNAFDKCCRIILPIYIYIPYRDPSTFSEGTWTRQWHPPQAPSEKVRLDPYRVYIFIFVHTHSDGYSLIHVPDNSVASTCATELSGRNVLSTPYKRYSGFRGSMAQTPRCPEQMGVHINHRHWGLCHWSSHSTIAGDLVLPRACEPYFVRQC